MSEFSVRVRKFLDERGIKHHHFAKECGLNVQTFSHFLNDRRDLSFQNTIKVLKVLNDNYHIAAGQALGILLKRAISFQGNTA